MMFLAQVTDKFSAEWWREVAFGTSIAVAMAVVVTIATKLWSRRAGRKAAEAEKDPATARPARRRATVIGLIAGTVQIVAWVTVLLVLMSELGVPLGPLFASAGVLGVALGFGAQTVVKDTLAGLFIALEGQFDVGDVLDLQTEGGPVTGTVEGLTLRVTIVRQYDGTLSTVPNGSIQVTSNKTRGWGRAIVDVRVALTEDPERVRTVLDALFAQMAVEEPLKDWLRDPPKVARGHPAHRHRPGDPRRRRYLAEPSPGGRAHPSRSRDDLHHRERDRRAADRGGASHADARPRRRPLASARGRRSPVTR